MLGLQKSQHKLPSPNHCESGDFLLVNKNLSPKRREEILSAGPPDRVELIGAGSLGYGTGPSFGCEG